MDNDRARRSGGAVLAVFGLVCGLLPVWHFLSRDESSVSALVGVVVPFVLAGVIVYGSVWVTRSDCSSSCVRRLLGWTAVGAVTGGLAAILFALYQTDHGAVLVDVEFVVVDAATGGAVLGLVVGQYDVRSRSRAAALNATSEVLETVRQVNQAVTRTRDRSALEQRVCEEFATSTPYRFAWVGSVDDSASRVVPRASAGVEDGYLDEIDVPLVDEATGPTARAVLTGTCQVIQNIPEDPAYEKWRAQATQRGYRSSAAIPLVYDGTVYGVLNVYADRRNAFAARERRILEELGETIGHGIAAIEAHERDRTLMEASPDAIVVTDLDTRRIVEVNAKAERLLGRSREALVGSALSTLWPADRRDDYDARVDELVDDGPILEPGYEMTERELVLAAADGTEIPVELSARTIELEGRPVIQGTFRDVTERRAREQRLTELEEAIEQAGDGIIITDRDGIVRYVNPAFERMTGYDADELLGKTPERWQSGSHSESFYDELWETILAGEEWRSEFENERKDGTRYYVEQTVTPLVDDAGEIQGFVGVSTDITHRREMEESLREREERFRCMFEQHSAPMLLLDPETGAIVDVNEAAVDYYGYDEATLTGQTIADVNELPETEIREHLQQVVDRERKSFVFDHQLASGETRTVEVHSTPIPVDGGTRLFSIVHDITDRTRYQETLERHNDQLAVLNGLLRHDIRNDMAVIIGMAELLTDHVDDDATDTLQTLRDKADHVVELTHTARKLTESMGTAPDDGHEAVDLRATLEHVLDDVRASYQTVDLHVDGDVPTVDVWANEMLDSVFGNILHNAVQHNDRDTPHVTVSCRRSDDRVEVRIADDGPGIPDRMKERVFDHGERGTESTGTGLGLYLVGTLVDQFGGDVWIEDTEPRGTAFVVSLRAVKSDTA